jgi:CO/xanthine dehydrogenase FAD-binding subunit
MRAFIPNYQLITPRSLDEALALLAQQPGNWKPFAGGTDLMVLLEANKLPHTNYLNIWNLNELRAIDVTPSQITIGALTTYTQIQKHKILQREFPMLCQAARETGGLAIQNRGTLGGNIANASPAADSPPALLAYDATLELVSVSGVRSIPYNEFHRDYKQMNLRADELLARIHLPRSKKETTHYYRKVGTRKAQAISKVCFAAIAHVEKEICVDVRIGLGSVAPVPLRCRRTESIIRGRSVDETLKKEAIKELSFEISPISDIRSTRDYRLRVCQNLLKDFLEKLKQ